MVWSPIIIGHITLLAIILSASPAFADCMSDLFARYADQRTKTLSLEKLQEMQHDPQYHYCAATRQAQIARKTIASRQAKKTNASELEVSDILPNTSPPTRPLPPAKIVSIKPFLRKDFADLWLFQDPSEVINSEGATFSISSDQIARNSAWTVHAMAAMSLQYENNTYGSEPNFIGYSIAPYIEIYRISNSNRTAQKNNVDQMTGGGSFEFGFDLLGGSQYFRARGAAVQDNITDKTTGSAVFEWIPVYNKIVGSPFGLPYIPVVFVLAPEFQIRYDDVVVNDVQNVKSYLWRMGPEATLRYRFDAEFLPQYFQRIHGQTTYSWLTSAETQKSYSYFSTSLSYDIDKDGHVSLTGSYTDGRTVLTGRKVDLWEVELTAKW